LRKTIVTIGLLLILTGVFLQSYGSSTLVHVATITGLVTHVEVENPIVPTTLVPVQASNFTYVSADLVAGTMIRGTVQVEGEREIGFYVMDEGNFSEWRNGRPANILLAKPLTISSNFTLTPNTSATYFFIFDNQDRDGRVIVFNVNSIQDVTVLPAAIQYLDYELFLVGMLLTILGIKTGRKSKTHKPVTQKCRFCGAKLQSDQSFCPKCNRSQK